MRILIWGSRSLTWKHFGVMRAVALYASLSHVHDECGGVPPLSVGLFPLLLAGGDDDWHRLPESEPLVLLHGDGPPGKTPGAVGADKLAEGACMLEWPERRRIRRFPVEQKEGETWGKAAARRDVAMAEARPDRAFCIHTDLDSSKGSIITARALTARRVGYWYVQTSASGSVLKVQKR